LQRGDFVSFLGNIEYFILNDGHCRVDGGGAFGLVPRIIWQQLIPPDDNNCISFALNSLLIRSEGQTILVDTGYGNKLSQKAYQRLDLQRPAGDLVTQLARLGVAVDEVDLVINTHLHADHCGGNTRFEGDRLVPTFPKAQYIIQRLEWADAVVPNERTRATYFHDNYAPLQANDQLKLVNGDTKLTNEVHTAVTRGHTRAHQIVVLESHGERAIFVADLTTLHYHFQRLAWVTAYDVEPLESIETKRYWQTWAVESDALVIFQHDSQIPTGKLKQEGQHFVVEPFAVE
jgi:glyoxylase-like metal-dependent hydrolase (beta-lactamase superfamily II)